MKLRTIAFIPAALTFLCSPIKAQAKPLTQASNNQQETSSNYEISKSSMIKTVLTVAGLGMTSICLFYILKDKNIIK